MDESCLHGSWEDGVCQCERGYVTEFTDTKLYPIYCAEKDDIYVLNLRRGYESVDFLHYVTLSVFELVRFTLWGCFIRVLIQLTVGVATGSFLGFLFFLYTLLDACLLSRNIKKAERKLEELTNNQIRRDPTENLNAELWYPDPRVFLCINDPNFTAEKGIRISIKTWFSMSQ